MSKCRQCNVEILDETERCPLCNSVVEFTFEVENMYPNVKTQTRKLVFLSRVYLVAAIWIGSILFGINYVDKYQIGWSLVAGLVLLYGYLLLKLAISGQTGHKLKIIILAVITIIMMILMDFIIGYRGWSVNYALPGCVILMDIGIMALMVKNRRNWQSYIMWQILMMLVSGGMVLMYMFEIITVPHIVGVATILSVFTFLGTIIVGDRRARVELYRRFHI